MKEVSYIDFTIKARLRNREETEKAILQLEPEFVGVDIQRDHYFKVPNGRLKYREGTIENLITHYERVADNELEKTIVYRYNIDPSQEEIEELFGMYQKIGITKKERMIFKIGNIKIHIDKMPDSEEFIEIEAMDQEGLYSSGELKAQCLMMKAKLALPDEDFLKTGYFKNVDQVSE